MQNDELKEIKNIFRKVDGWLTFREGLFLFNSTKRCRSGSIIVEIGSWKGRSTICLAKGSKAGKGAKIFAIDPHVDGTSSDFQRNIRDADVDDLVVPIIKTSEEASNGWSTPVDFILHACRRFT